MECKIYEGEAPGQPLFTVAYFKHGRRLRDTRASFERAKAREEQLVEDISDGSIALVDINPEDRAPYSRAIAALQGYPVDLAAIEYADARKKLGGRTLAEAVDFFVKRNPTNGLDLKTVCQLKDEFLRAKRADRRSEIYPSKTWRCALENSPTHFPALLGP